MEKIQAWITDDAKVWTSDGMLLSLRTSSGKEIKHILTHCWIKFVFAELVHRKGAPVNEINLSLQWRVFSRMTDVDQKLTALNLVGGFQTNAIKSKWDDDVQVKCSFCDEYDSRGHRVLSFLCNSACPSGAHGCCRNSDGL